jgi:hypothetical protein
MANVPTNVRKWTSLIWRLTWALSISIVVIAGLVIALIADARANGAAVQSRDTSNCVNNILATRNKPSTDDNNAVLAYLRADAEYNRRLNAVFAAPKDQQLALFEKFKAASVDKDRVVSHAIAIITHDKQLRAAHPLGKC